MKKIMILAAAAALTLTACVKTETVKNTEAEPVTFGVYTAKTKAVSATTYGTIDQTALQNSTYGFGVFAFHSDGNANSYAAGTPSNFQPNFMYNQQVKYESSAWTYTPVKYWPNEYNTTNAIGSDVDKLTFFAYAPYVATNAVGTEGITAFSENTSTGDPTLSFKVPAASDEQIDLLWNDADLKNKTKMAVNGKVQFNFVHALSNLSIYPLAVVDGTTIPESNGTDLASGTTITINSITITGTFNQEGTLNLATGVWTSSAASADQTVTYQPTTAYDVTNINDKDEATTPVAQFMFIPSSAAADYVININYDVTTTDSALATGKSVVNNNIHKTLSSLSFEKGKKMNLYVALGMTSVKFEAVVGDWTDVTPDQDVWLPVNL